jgi:hypothetical protein
MASPHHASSSRRPMGSGHPGTLIRQDTSSHNFQGLNRMWPDARAAAIKALGAQITAVEQRGRAHAQGFGAWI